MAGRRPVAEAFAAHRPAKRLLVVPERRAALEQLVLHATSLRIPVVEVEGGTLTAVSGFDGHQGIALVVEPRRWATIDDVFARANERGEAPFLLVLDSLEDPQNVGSLLRTADACGVHGVMFPTRHSAPISPAAVKASAGAVEHLLLVPLDDLGGGLVDLHSRGLRIVGADEKAALSYRDADLRGPLALAVGSEGHGISGGIRRRLDLAVRIPMHGQVASLNVAVAGSVLLFEAASQRPHGERVATVAPDAEAQPVVVSPETVSGPTEVTAAAADASPAKPKRTRAAKLGSTAEPEAVPLPESEAAPAKPKRTRAAKASPASEPKPAAAKRRTRAAKASPAAEPNPAAAKPKRTRAAKASPTTGAAPEPVATRQVTRKPRSVKPPGARPAPGGSDTAADADLLPGEPEPA